MSGHSRWSQIKRQKEASDQKKGRVFSKLAKKITVAAGDGTNPGINYKLQAAINEARDFNMPKENIERAIKRAEDSGTSGLETVIIQAVVSGPPSQGSVAVVIEAITDKRNRTISEIRNILNKNGAKMVAEGSLDWMFDRDWKPHSPMELNDPAVSQKLEKLFEELDNHDDVENIHSNLK